MIYYYGEWWDDNVYMTTTYHDDYNWRSAGEQICNGKKAVLQDNPFVLDADEAYNLFNGCTGIENIEYLDISACKNLSCMFYGYNNSDNTTLDLSWLDVSNVTNMESMFSNSSVEYLNLMGWNVSKVRNFDSMFQMCEHLRNIYVDSGTNWQTATGGRATGTDMFSNCISLPNYDSYEWDLNMATSVGGYFSAREPKWIKCLPYRKENGVWVPVEVYK